MAQQMALKQYNKLRTDVTQSGKLEMQNKYIADGLNQIANQLDKDSTEHKLHEGLKTWNKVKQDMELKQGLLQVADELDVKAHNENRSNKHKLIAVNQTPMVQTAKDFSENRNKIIKNVEPPRQHKDYLAYNQNIFTNAGSHEHLQNIHHQNRHGQESLIMGVPDHVYTRAVGEQLKNSSPPVVPVKGSVEHVAQKQHQLTQPQNLLNNHTSTDAPRVVFKEHGGLPTTQGIHTMSGHPTLVSFDNQNKMFASAY